MSGTIGLFNKAFQTSIHDGKASDGTVFHRPDATPTLRSMRSGTPVLASGRATRRDSTRHVSAGVSAAGHLWLRRVLGLRRHQVQRQLVLQGVRGYEPGAGISTLDATNLALFLSVSQAPP